MTEVKTNYKNKYKDYNCVACEKNNTFVEETQEHIYVCKNIKENNEDFFNDIWKQTRNKMYERYYQ